MFKSSRGSKGLGALIAVALIIGGYLATAGFMWKAYADGGDTFAVAADPHCELVCAPAEDGAKEHQG